MYSLSVQKFQWAHDFGVTTNSPLLSKKGRGSKINPTPATHAFFRNFLLDDLVLLTISIVLYI